MGQIVKGKKKGRPSKADLAARGLSVSEREVRRSLRRRNVRKNAVDYDDDFIEDDDEEEEEEEVGRREKKVKLVVKLHSNENARSSAARGRNAQGNGAFDEDEDEDEEEERGKKPLKKRKINGVDDTGYDSDNIDDNNDYRDDHVDDDDEVRVRKGDNTGQDSAPGTPTEAASGLPLPDNKVLELILDKLQKKDIYGVYAEPVDLEELPDYLDYIDHPMDFATVRKKLANGSYCTLKQFESDVFLICSNAMQYNAPETIYHKQACSIEELATRKFQRLKANIERGEKEMKSEQKTKSNSLGKKQMKKPLGRAVQEPVGSDFSSGATLATPGDFQNGSAANHASGCERPFVTDGPLEGNYSLVDTNLDKMDDMPGKGVPSKLGRKPYIVDENRRATYNEFNQTASKSNSIFTIFENEVKQLVSVGLHAEYAYARSLAHFAATLGPVAWKIASQRIEQALPAGFKFGRGWVGEYEPLPTSVLMLEPQTQKESHFFSKLKSTADARKVNMTSKTPLSPKEHLLSGPGKEHFVLVKDDEHFLCRPPREPFAPGKEHRSGSVREHFVPAKDHPVSGSNSEGKPPLFHPRTGPVLGAKQSLFASAGMAASNPVAATYLQQNLPFRNTAVPENKVLKQVELNLPPPVNQHDADLVSDKQLSNNSEMPVSRSREMVSRNLNLPQPLPFKRPDYNGVGSRGLPNGKVTGNPLNGGMVSSSTDTVPNQVTKAATYFSLGQEKSLGDPAEFMWRLAENGQKHQRSSNHPPADSPSVAASVPSVRNDSGNASSTAARAWMSIRAGAFKQPTENSSTHKTQISAELLYNPTRQLHPQSPRVQGQSPPPTSMQLSDKNTFQFQVFPPQPFRLGNDSQLQDRPMVFPQLVTTDFSRFHAQSPWRGLSPHSQTRPKQDTLPPDLNIGFQPPGSPVKQSSNGIMDSQLPDLALQL
ncbi:hypothetical protein HS088_TW21G00557 [Tripterygium wilfordii]|uniref:Bromo domain-containing protein n=1 Tax=Tripterygium wilfordii TaxID=458696 RepID=A0A7J7C2M5_TRIWF|nr:uncharacterized protein LOC119988986 isoform X2 [Tripterygium wilfordii]KAF5728410.1 hypothetical protein HS088_TW21G00557 [Tripterygium wilfordii]